jgi:hypothetical protein
MDFLQSFAAWLETTRLHPVITYPWVWPTLEAIHFIGLALLLGAIIPLDLRMLGMAKQVPLGPLHQLALPWAVTGFTLCLATGSLFIVGQATSYVGNMALYLKLGALLLTGLNVLLFYTTAISRRVEAVGPGQDAPLPAKMVAATSLFLWFSVITLGRMIGII